MLAWTDHLPEILNERIQNISRRSISRYRKTCEGQWRATVRVQRHGPGAKTTEVEARVVLVCASTDDSRPLTGGANLIWTVVDYSETSSLVSVKLIPCMCSHVSSPGRSVSGQGHAY